MDRLEGCAWRDRQGTHIQLAGLLPKYYGRATIVDIYPEGEINYEKDPGCAEVFIDEWSADIAADANGQMPWQENILIPTQSHERVKIYVNGHEELEICIGVSCEDGAPVLQWPSFKQAEGRRGISGVV